jgi:proline iminopeptidase
MGIDGNSLRVPGVLDLATQGIRVVIPDQRGHGQSSSGSDREYSHDVWVSDARVLTQQLGLPRLALLGHSYGGFLALEYAVRWPESLTHLVLVATSAGPVPFVAADAASDLELRETFRFAWPRYFAGENKHWDLFDSLHFNLAPYVAAFSRELPAYDLRERVEGLQVPTLLIVGSADAYRPHMEWLAEHMPRAQLYMLQNVGHFPYIEAADTFTASVADFLHGREAHFI